MRDHVVELAELTARELEHVGDLEAHVLEARRVHVVLRGLDRARGEVDPDGAHPGIGRRDADQVRAGVAAELQHARRARVGRREPVQRGDGRVARGSACGNGTFS